MSSPVLMKCGCVAHGTCSAKDGVKYDPPVPVCITHDCLEVSENSPILEGRQARCKYFGCGGFRDHGPIYGGGSCDRRACKCVVASKYELPFFVYKGDGSPTAYELCACGHAMCVHWPRWRVRFKVIRRWYKIERSELTESEEEHLPGRAWAEKWAAARQGRWMKMGDGPGLSGDMTEPTKVHSAELLDLEEIPKPRNTRACANFRPGGAVQYDEFFCGCAGWD